MFTIAKTIFKNLFSKPATRVAGREAFDGARGHLVIEESKCIYCGICAKKCPALAIKVDRKPNQNWTLDPFKCIICSACVEACPKKCLHLDKNFRSPSSN